MSSPLTGHRKRQVIVQQDNVRLHVTKATKDIICFLG